MAKAGFSVTSEPVTTKVKGFFTIKKRNENVKAALSEFLEASENLNKNALVEALDANWHYGAFDIFDRLGHIPNAIMLPFDDFYNEDKNIQIKRRNKK